MLQIRMMCNSAVSVIRGVKGHAERSEQPKWRQVSVCWMMHPVRTIITISLCMYDFIYYFQTCNNVAYESNALYVV
jgi:hypothetical protein